MVLRLTHWMAALMGVALLCACTKPTAMTPKVTPQEVAAERARQEQMLTNAVQLDYEDVSFSKEDLTHMAGRLQQIVNKLAPEATKLCRELNGPSANCDMRISLSSKGKGINAHADGKKIVVNAALIDFAESDSHLAFVIAHEYTHHMMRHVSSTQQNVMAGGLLGTVVDVIAASQGINTRGQAGKMGAQASLLAYSPSFEHESDYIGLYILARAGFDYQNAPEFWRLMSRNNPQGIYNRTTHPTTPERFVAMSKTIEEIYAKKAKGLRLLPNFKAKS